MGHFYKKEIQNLRVANMDSDKPTPAKVSKKKPKKPFEVQRKFIGKKDFQNNLDKLFRQLYSREWKVVERYTTMKGAEQALKAESRKAWLGANWEYRIVDTTKEQP